MLWAYLAIGALWLGGAYAFSANAIISHHVSIDSGGGLTILDNPTGSDAWWWTVQAVFFPAVAVCWLVWLTGQVFSYRRSSGERRLQLKWLLSGATVFIASGIAVVWINNPSGLWKAVDFLSAVGILALPVSIGFGIMKFRLYDIDRVISRTLAYAIVTGLLVGVYAGLVLLATQVFRFHNSVATAAATLAAAATSSGADWKASLRSSPGWTPTWRSIRHRYATLNLIPRPRSGPVLAASPPARANTVSA